MINRILWRLFFAGMLGVTLQGGVALAADAPPITITLKNNRFDPAEIEIPANTPATLLVKNLDAAAEEFESKPFKIEKVIAGNGQGLIKIKGMPPGRYEFVGEYHEDVAKGVIIVK